MPSRLLERTLWVPLPKCLQVTLAKARGLVADSLLFFFVFFLFSDFTSPLRQLKGILFRLKGLALHTLGKSCHLGKGLDAWGRDQSLPPSPRRLLTVAEAPPGLGFRPTQLSSYRGI